MLEYLLSTCEVLMIEEERKTTIQVFSKLKIAVPITSIGIKLNFITNKKFCKVGLSVPDKYSQKKRNQICAAYPEFCRCTFLILSQSQFR